MRLSAWAEHFRPGASIIKRSRFIDAMFVALRPDVVENHVWFGNHALLDQGQSK